MEASMKKAAWFSDMITFWQIWNTLPIAHLERYFYDKEEAKVPIYTIAEGVQKRIACLSMFQSGVQPMWEDEVNKKGSEFRVQLHCRTNRDTIPQQAVGDVVTDVVQGRFPYYKEVAGVRISDQSRDGHDGQT